jgi:hypothetical protein
MRQRRSVGQVAAVLCCWFQCANVAHAFEVAPRRLVSPSRRFLLSQPGLSEQPVNHHVTSSRTELFMSSRDETTKNVIEEMKGLFPYENNSTLTNVLLGARDILSPAALVLDEATNGWALSYADLKPESEETPLGQAFLATNIAYSTVGLVLSFNGDFFLGFIMELVATASFVYHFAQLQQPFGRSQDTTVRTALMVDYTFALSSIFIGLFYLASDFIIDHKLPPFEGFASASVSLLCLFACWVWERGYPYIVLHSLWHIFSAFACYSVGMSHLES